MYVVLYLCPDGSWCRHTESNDWKRVSVAALYLLEHGYTVKIDQEAHSAAQTG